MIRQIRFEFKKHFLRPSMLAVIVAFLLLDTFQISSLYHEKAVLEQTPEFKTAYDQLYEEYSGTITEEKISRLLDLYRPIKTAVDEGGLSTAYDPESLTYNAYSDEIFLRWCFVDPMEYAYRYRENAVQIARNAVENAAFYQSAGNEYAGRENRIIANAYAGRNIPEFHDTEMYQYYLQYDFSIFFVLLIGVYGLVNVFVMEKESEMELLILTSVAGGRRTTIAKVMASLLFMAGICLVFWAADLLLFTAFWGGFEGGDCPIYAVQFFEQTPLSITLLQYSVLSMGLKTLGVLALSLLILCVSCWFKNALFPFVLSLLSIGACLALYTLEFPAAVNWLAHLNPITLLVNRQVLYRTEFINWFGQPVPTWLLPLCAAAGLCVLFIIFIFSAAKKTCLIPAKGKEVSPHGTGSL